MQTGTPRKDIVQLWGPQTQTDNAAFNFAESYWIYFIRRREKQREQTKVRASKRHFSGLTRDALSFMKRVIEGDFFNFSPVVGVFNMIRSLAGMCFITRIEGGKGKHKAVTIIIYIGPGCFSINLIYKICVVHFRTFVLITFASKHRTTPSQSCQDRKYRRNMYLVYHWLYIVKKD